MSDQEEFDVRQVAGALAQAELDHTHALQRGDEEAVNEALARADEIKALLAANGYDDAGLPLGADGEITRPQMIDPGEAAADEDDN